MKVRSNNILARLKGRTWEGEPAPDYLYTRLMGEDGEPAWELADAAKRLSRKLKVRVNAPVVSKWLKAEAANRRWRDNYELMNRSTLEFFAEREESGLSVTEMVDAQVVLMIGRIHADDGVEEAVTALNAFTKFKQANTAEFTAKQKATEWQESTAKLKARIEELCKALKKHGGSAAQIDQFNRDAVKAVDETLLRG